MAVLRVVVHGDHLQLVNPLRSHRIAWRDVENIELVSDRGWHVLVWVGDVPIRAWGLSKIGRFGAAANSAYDDSRTDAPRWLREGYSTLRRYWRKRR
ncbi:PH domain-containing protein [Micromonospora sp. NPDC003197]